MSLTQYTSAETLSSATPEFSASATSATPPRLQIPTFSFEQEGKYDFEIRDQIYARLQRMSSSVAVLYFVKDNVKVDIPRDLFVYDQTHGGIELTPIKNQYFAMCWTDNYLIKWNGNTVLLSTQRQWSVKSACPLKILSL